ncbi:MAG: F0F1 ATP synthase subunit gamma [Acetobacteraceae bacterium]
MTDRLSDIHARIDGILQLRSVVGAMRGIAAARAQQARAGLPAVDSFALTIASAIGRVLASRPDIGQDAAASGRGGPRPALILFCAEQGFAGAFSEKVLDAAAADLSGSQVFLVGSRGWMIAQERGVSPAWRGAMPSRSNGVSRLADRITEALFARIATGDVDTLEVLFTRWRPGGTGSIKRRRLFPLDLARFRGTESRLPPICNLAPEPLLTELTSDYLFAQLCSVALHAFAAENEARMEAMSATHSQIEHQLEGLRAQQRLVRQDEITAEIIELAAGETASRSAGRQAVKRRPASRALVAPSRAMSGQSPT